jgi:hypothetical protein
MDRRAFLGLAGTLLLAAPLTAEAQPAGRMYRIGWIGIAPSPTNDPLREAFIGGMRERGWIEGQNFAVERRS